jgi:protein phosphatase
MNGIKDMTQLITRTATANDDIETPHYVFEAASVSQLGQYHDKNEDRAVYTQHFFAIADGVGGGTNGDIAAETLLRYCADIVNWQDPEQLQQAIIASEPVVQAALQQVGNQRGATTLAAAWLNDKGQGFISWVGDVRLYHLQQQAGEVKITQLTIDQTYANLGEISSTGKQDSPARMIGTNAVGKPPVVAITLAEHDCLLIASDGVHRFVDPQTIAACCQPLLSPNYSLNKVCQQLVETALDNQGYDDTTALLVRFKPKPVLNRASVTAEEPVMVDFPQVDTLPKVVSNSKATWRNYPAWRYGFVAACVCALGVVLGYATAKATRLNPVANECPPVVNIPSFQIEPLPTSTWLTPLTPDNPATQGKK